LAPPVVSKYAPNDHRIDGAHLERQAWLPYYVKPTNSNDPLTAAVYKYNGSLSYWMKPNFFPEFNSQFRVFADMSGGGYFTHYYIWGEDVGKLYEDYMYTGGVFSPLFPQLFTFHRPVTMTFIVTGQRGVFKSVYGSPFYYAYIFSCSTPTLNHNGHSVFPYHKSSSTLLNTFSAHKWVHTTVSWGYDTNTITEGAWPTNEADSKSIYCKIFVNGRVIDKPNGTYFNCRSPSYPDSSANFKVTYLVIGGARGGSSYDRSRLYNE
jgi:hypothetical protein